MQVARIRGLFLRGLQLVRFARLVGTLEEFRIWSVRPDLAASLGQKSQRTFFCIQLQPAIWKLVHEI
jgi:hypothetical protein